ncbi:hypothetical protein AVEN_178301-1 [Araneus ventricosus]|uniref:Uncharacterized protein n=1 Tax=Araneus ventricosus TaxID=182803 RepID=A0A4Y2NJ64_ARAVE|nr:hypothetical protein AVEN_178301-1 [Araneus ventricosus]
MIAESFLLKTKQSPSLLGGRRYFISKYLQFNTSGRATEKKADASEQFIIIMMKNCLLCGLGLREEGDNGQRHFDSSLRRDVSLWMIKDVAHNGILSESESQNSKRYLLPLV